jgi:CheY-like chemotaxis protein
VISAPKTVLIVDDEPAVRWLLQQGLPPHLPEFAVATVANGQEAIDYLSAYPVEVMVTDINMPVKDGFELLAHVRNHHPNLPVVVLASTAPGWITERAPQLGAMRVLQKPTSPELVAHHVLEACSETVRGRMSGVPLATLLQLMQLERKTCSLLVRSGARKGRLHFLSGQLVNAYAFDLAAEGEAAARHLLALDKVTIDFERSLHNHVRRIHTPLETLLLEVATHVDEANRDAAQAERSPAAGTVVPPKAEDPACGDADAGHAAVPSIAPRPPLGRPTASASPVRPATSISTALEVLQEALSDLRTRSDATATLLEAATLELARGAAALPRPVASATAAGVDEERLAAAWGEVSELAARLVRAADALGVRTGTVGP